MPLAQLPALLAKLKELGAMVRRWSAQ
jgi:hypothetical protein